MKNYFNYILVLIFAFLIPVFSFASSVSLESSKNAFASSEDFLVELVLDSKGENVNAVEGSVIFPNEFLELKEIRDGNSIINFWIEKPKVSGIGKVSFSGMTAGGISSNKAFIFSMIFHPKKDGAGNISFEDLKVLKNDGVGTKANVVAKKFVFSISKKNNSSSPDLSLKDKDAPESFEPFLGDDTNLFSGKYFLVFDTQDKGSGIDHFEVKEGFFGKYAVASSPYLLKHQFLLNDVYVKAFDKSGNEKLAIWQTTSFFGKYKIYLIIAIIFIVSIFWFKKNA